MPFTGPLSRWPWWALVLALAGIFFAIQILTDSTLNEIFSYVAQGLLITVRVTLIAYFLALILGLVLALARVSKNILAYQISTIYVEVVRGVPTLVLILYTAFVLTPAGVDLVSGIGGFLVNHGVLPSVFQALAGLKLRDVDYEFSVTAALAINYAAFLSEIFRAGIESIDPGQMEAARALGMGYWQAMRHVILRQAIRRVMPPLGNDFIAMLKESSLVAFLGVKDITLRARQYESQHFLPLESYNVLAYTYLVMTLLLSMVVKWVERRMARERRA